MRPSRTRMVAPPVRTAPPSTRWIVPALRATAPGTALPGGGAWSASEAEKARERTAVRMGWSSVLLLRLGLVGGHRAAVVVRLGGRVGRLGALLVGRAGARRHLALEQRLDADVLGAVVDVLALDDHVLDEGGDRERVAAEQQHV